jgi:hypothetical protein
MMSYFTIDQVRDLFDRSLHWLQANNEDQQLQEDLLQAINYIDRNFGTGNTK